jgi:hypothetical protein
MQAGVSAEAHHDRAEDGAAEKYQNERDDRDFLGGARQFRGG